MPILPRVANRAKVCGSLSFLLAFDFEPWNNPLHRTGNLGGVSGGGAIKAVERTIVLSAVKLLCLLRRFARALCGRRKFIKAIAAVSERGGSFLAASVTSRGIQRRF